MSEFVYRMELPSRRATGVLDAHVFPAEYWNFHSLCRLQLLCVLKY